MHLKVAAAVAARWGFLSSQEAHEIGRRVLNEAPVTQVPDPSPIIVGIIFGAFCGALVGFILTRIVRFIAYMAGRNFGGNFLILIFAVAGAAILGWLGAVGKYSLIR